MVALRERKNKPMFINDATQSSWRQNIESRTFARHAPIIGRRLRESDTGFSIATSNIRISGGFIAIAGQSQSAWRHVKCACRKAPGVVRCHVGKTAKHHVENILISYQGRESSLVMGGRHRKWNDCRRRHYHINRRHSSMKNERFAEYSYSLGLYRLKMCEVKRADGRELIVERRPVIEQRIISSPASWNNREAST